MTRPIAIEGLVVTVIIAGLSALLLSRIVTGKTQWRDTYFCSLGIVVAWLIWSKP